MLLRRTPGYTHPMVQHVRLFAGATFVFLALTGCHGGGSSGLTGVIPGSSQMQSKSPATASFSVFVPAAATGAKTPQSLVVSLLQVNGVAPASKTTPFTMNLTSTTHGCAPMPGGAVS